MREYFSFVVRRLLAAMPSAEHTADDAKSRECEFSRLQLGRRALEDLREDRKFDIHGQPAAQLHSLRREGVFLREFDSGRVLLDEQ